MIDLRHEKHISERKLKKFCNLSKFITYAYDVI